MTRWLLLALVFVLFAAYWTAAHPPQPWDFFPPPLPVDEDNLLDLNPV
jgi:hypothetical protein